MSARMRRRSSRQRKAGQRGLTLIEVLISVVILLAALLGAAGLIARSNQSEMESYQRVQALTLLQDMVTRLNANRQAAPATPSRARSRPPATAALRCPAARPAPQPSRPWPRRT